jgi:hypothetical protein
MTLRDSTIVEILDELDRLDEAGDHNAALLRARVLDDVLATLTPPQRLLLDRWHSYVCEKCGHTMVTHQPKRSKRRR